MGLLQQCCPFDFSQVESRLPIVACLSFMFLNLGFWIFGIGRIPLEDSLKERSGLSEDSSNSERYQPAVMDQSIQALQAQLAKIQGKLAAQNKIIVNLTANRQHIPQPNSCDNMAEYLMKQFIKSQITIFNELNP
jgi:hypothetical protein